MLFVLSFLYFVIDTCLLFSPKYAAMDACRQAFVSANATKVSKLLASSLLTDLFCVPLPFESACCSLRGFMKDRIMRVSSFE